MSVWQKKIDNGGVNVLIMHNDFLQVCMGMLFYLLIDSFIHQFMYIDSFIMHLLGTYYMPGNIMFNVIKLGYWIRNSHWEYK